MYASLERRLIYSNDTHDPASCVDCAANKLSFCNALRDKTLSDVQRPNSQPLLSAIQQTIPARRNICHPAEWYDTVPVICRGWAASSITLPDGRRQILSFLLPGDIVSTAYLFEPMGGRLVEAITEVRYRNFKRVDLKAMLLRYPDLFEVVSKIWVEERAQADQLALDLGRRTADERIARLILNLWERLAKRGMVQDQTLEFPLRQRHVADATGLTPVHVSKVLGEFRRSGMIELDERLLTITNPAELRRIAAAR